MPTCFKRFRIRQLRHANPTKDTFLSQVAFLRFQPILPSGRFSCKGRLPRNAPSVNPRADKSVVVVLSVRSPAKG